jgi:hypothetical protein
LVGLVAPTAFMLSQGGGGGPTPTVVASQVPPRETRYSCGSYDFRLSDLRTGSIEQGRGEVAGVLRRSLAGTLKSEGFPATGWQKLATKSDEVLLAHPGGDTLEVARIGRERGRWRLGGYGYCTPRRVRQSLRATGWRQVSRGDGGLLRLEVDIGVCTTPAGDVDDQQVALVEEQSGGRRSEVKIVVFVRDLDRVEDFCFDSLRSKPLTVRLRDRSSSRRVVDAGVLRRYE